jgi:hypothetical protein
MRIFIIATEHTEQRTVASLSGSKRVHFDGKTRFNKKHAPSKRQQTGRKRGGSKVRYPTSGLDQFYKPGEWKALSPKKAEKWLCARRETQISHQPQLIGMGLLELQESFAQQRSQVFRPHIVLLPWTHTNPGRV